METLTSRSVAVQSDPRRYKVPPFIRHASISQAPGHLLGNFLRNFQWSLPMSKAMLSTWATLDPTVMSSRAGFNNKAFVTLECATSTPFGVPVLPIQG